MSQLDFGDYCHIEQKRYGCDNEMYLHKVIGRFDSNAWVEVPVDGDGTNRDNVLHGEMSPVVACICCGVMETEVRKYRIADVVPVQDRPAQTDAK